MLSTTTQRPFYDRNNTQVRISQSVARSYANRSLLALKRLALLLAIALVLVLIDINGSNSGLNDYSPVLDVSASSSAPSRRAPLVSLAEAKEYYYTRTRNNPNHLRISEEFKNPYVKEIKLQSTINGTKYDYYKSSMTMSHDELVFETIDKIFQHRLSPFYVHHYDNEEDKRKASDPRLVSQEACSRDLMYLLDKLPKRSSARDPYTNNDEDHLTPELAAFFDSYARTEAGLLLGNTYWVGGYQQCINRHIFELYKKPAWFRPASAEQQQHQQQLSDGQHHQDQWSRSKRAGGGGSRQDEEHQEVISFKGRYCVSSLKSRTWDSIIQAKKARSKSYFKTQRQFNDYSKLFRLQVGICLPDSCDSSSLDRHAEEIKLLTTNWLEQRYADYELIDLYCLPDESSPLRAWSGSALCFSFAMALWASLILAATAMDFLDDDAAANELRSSKSRNFVAWFSLRANYNKLMHVSDEHHGHAAAESKEASEGAPAAQTNRLNSTQCKSETSKDENQQQQQQPELTLTLTKRQRKQAERRQQRQQLLAQHQQSRNATLDEKEATTPPQLMTTTTTTTERAEHDEAAPASTSLMVNLRFLNAFKVLVMFWIINGHIMLLVIQTAKNILNSDALLNGLMHFLIGATFGVDLFFTITGFLTSYLIFNSGHAYKMRPTTWLYLSLHRYWRLAPLYLLTFWFSRSMLQLLGTGPLWDYGTSSLTFRGLCNHESWWYPLTLTSNLHGLFDECMITSWYISCDMQFWLVSPLYIYLLAKAPLAGWLACLSTIFTSSKVRYDAILEEPSARYDELVQPRADIFMRVSHDLPALYTHPHYRIAPYIVGLLAGHYVYMLKSGKWASPIAAGCPQSAHQQQQHQREAKGRRETTAHAPAAEAEAAAAAKEAAATKTKEDETRSARGSRTVATTLATEAAIFSTSQLGRSRRNRVAYTGLFLLLCMSFCSYLMANYFPAALLKYAKPIAAVLYACCHLLMSVGATLIIIAMCFGQWSNIVKFLSHPIWTRLSKLNYALLLLQCEATYYQIFRYDQVPLAGTKEIINILFNLLVTLYPLAFAVTLAFEFPLANMGKLLSVRRQRRQQR